MIPCLLDGITGRRHHLLRAATGQMMFSIEGEITGSTVLAVGSPDTTVLQMDRETWFRMVQSDGRLPAVDDLMTIWIAGLCSRTASDLPPRTLEPLLLNQSMELPNGTSAGCRDGVAWVRPTTGKFYFLGREDLGHTPDCSPAPICAAAWLTMAEDGSVLVETTAVLVSQGCFWASIDAFHRGILNAVRVTVDIEKSREQHRLAYCDELDRLTLDAALRSLGSLLEPKQVGLTDSEPTDPLFSALQKIGRVMGISFKMPDMTSCRNRQDSLLSLICRASGVRFRAVHLYDEWWMRENGPLLAFREDSLEPVALIPGRRGGYQLYAPHQSMSIRMTRTLANTLQLTAVMFYRPFPARLLSGWDFIRFGFHQSMQDGLRVVMLGLAGALLGLFTPVMTGILFDSVIPEAAQGRLTQIVFILIVCALAGVIFEFTKSIAMLRIESRSDTILQSALWDRLMGLPVSFFRKYTAGDLASRSMGVNNIRQILSGITVNTVLASLFSSLNFALLLYYDPQLSLVAAMLVGGGVSCTCAAGFLKIRYQRKVNEVQGNITGMVLQLISGISKIRVTGAENRAFAVWADRFREQKYLALRSGAVDVVLSIFNSGFPLVASMSIFAWMTFSGRSDLSTGQFLAFNAAFGSFQASLLQMSSALTSSLVIFPLFERLQPILQTLPEADEAKAPPGELTGAVDVDHIHFRYIPDGPLILSDISISCRPGEFVALVGGSGCGKSTLLRLLLGFETPESGSIYYDGKDIRGIDIREVRRQIGVVLQNGLLMPGDIFKNIVGAAALSQDDAWEAVRMAGMEDDIKRMPMGLHTVLSVGGGNLSGGQRQRLLIARALVRRPRMLFFDEATSALDNQTQASVSAGLKGLRATRLVIAHRLSTIMHADRIYVMEAGKIVQTGTFQSLIQQPGLFSELAKRQMS